MVPIRNIQPCPRRYPVMANIGPHTNQGHGPHGFPKQFTLLGLNTDVPASVRKGPLLIGQSFRLNRLLKEDTRYGE